MTLISNFGSILVPSLSRDRGGPKQSKSREEGQTRLGLCLVLFGADSNFGSILAPSPSRDRGGPKLSKSGRQNRFKHQKVPKQGSIRVWPPSLNFDNFGRPLSRDAVGIQNLPKIRNQRQKVPKRGPTRVWTLPRF